VKNPVNWDSYPEVAALLDLALSIDLPHLSNPHLSRNSHADNTSMPRARALAHWVEWCCLKTSKPFPMQKLVSSNAKTTKSQRDFSRWTYPSGRCFDHMQYFRDVASGNPACVMVNPYHFDPGIYEDTRPDLEAEGLTFAAPGLPVSLYDPIRTSTMLVVRVEDCPLQTLDPTALATELEGQKRNAETLVFLTALEQTYRLQPPAGRAFLTAAFSGWTPREPGGVPGVAGAGTQISNPTKPRRTT